MSDFFIPKNILFIKDYQFEDGSTKNKLLIILDVFEKELCVLQAITTSVHKFIPNSLITHGCKNFDLERLSFYVFEQSKIVGVRPNGTEFSFNDNTFILCKDNLSKELLSDFSKYKDNIRHLATLSEKEYYNLIVCISESKLVKRNLKPYFQAILTKLRLSMLD